MYSSSRLLYDHRRRFLSAWPSPLPPTCNNTSRKHTYALDGSYRLTNPGHLAPSSCSCSSPSSCTSGEGLRFSTSTTAQHSVLLCAVSVLSEQPHCLVILTTVTYLFVLIVIWKIVLRGAKTQSCRGFPAIYASSVCLSTSSTSVCLRIFAPQQRRNNVRGASGQPP